MQGLLCPLLLLLVSISAQAGEVQHASVGHQDGDYSIDISVKVDGDRDTIYRIATDYEKLSRLSDLIIETGLVESTGPDGTPTVRRRLLTKTCVLLFCFNAVLIEDLSEPENGIIKSVFVPEGSDFLYGEAVWQVMAIDKSHTMINFNCKFKPGFWVPPMIGPLFIKHMMLDAAEQTINNIEKIAALEKSGP